MQPNNKETTKNPYLKSIEESLKKNEKRKRMQEIGKLGGRPKKLQKKRFKYSLSLDEKQNNLAKIIQKENKISLQEFLRRKIENEPLPNPERNKILLQFFSNFNRIKNFFDSRIWEEEERRNFKKLLTETCEEILKNIKK